jgi:hypothetical protein
MKVQTCLSIAVSSFGRRITSAPMCYIAKRRLLPSILGLGLLFAGSAYGGPILNFQFENDPSPDNDAVDGTAAAFDSGGTVGYFYPLGGVKLTMVEGLAPTYTNAGSNTYSWDGISYTASNTNFNNQVAISNTTIPGTNDSNNFNPQESWTVEFDADVIFRTLDVNGFAGTDTMQVTVGALSPFNFNAASFDVDGLLLDPFGSSLVIPAGTHIKFLNNRTYASFPITGSNPSGGDAWGLQAFVVEVVPEPSSMCLAAFGFLGFGMARRRKER